MRYLSAVFALIASIACVACSKRAATGVTVDSSFKQFIPPNTIALAEVRVDKLEAAPLYKAHENELAFPQLDAFSERTGLDPRRDISAILIAWNGNQLLTAVRGSFNPNKIEPNLISMGMHRSSYKKHTLFGDERNSLVLMKRGLALAGSAETLKNAIDRQGGGEVSTEFEEKLDTLPRSDQIWAASVGTLPLTKMPMRSDVESALSNIVGYITGSVMGIGIDTGLHFQADFTCISDQGAQRVRDALRGGIGLARLTTKDNELELLRLYDSVHVDQDKSAVHVRADLSEELANKLLAYVPQIRNRAGHVLQNTPK